MTKVVLHDRVEGHLNTSAAARDVLLSVCRAHGVPVDWHESTDTLYISAPLHGKTIVVDAGHGGQDRYQTGRLGLVEADFVQAVANALAARLDEAGANVVRTRTGDETVDTATRQAIVTRAEPWAVISLHVGNRAQQRGAAAYVNWRRLWGGWRLARTALQHIADATPLPVRGLRLYPAQGRGGEGYQILTAARCPAAVFELGQLPSADDEAVLLQAGIAEQLADGLMAGLLALAGQRPRAPRATGQPAAPMRVAAPGAPADGAATVTTPAVPPAAPVTPAAPADAAAAHAAQVALAAAAVAPASVPAAPSGPSAPAALPVQPPQLTTANLGGQAAVVASGLLDTMRAKRPQVSPAAQAIRSGQPPPAPQVKFDPSGSQAGVSAAGAGAAIGAGPLVAQGQPLPRAQPAPARSPERSPLPPSSQTRRPPARPPASSGRQPFG